MSDETNALSSIASKLATALDEFGYDTHIGVVAD